PVPRAAWIAAPSELPYHTGLLRCPPERDRAGLFTVLIQRSNRRVRTLRGRYLWVRLALQGDGRSTPEVAALRAYASRFSYVHRYLPELYQEWELGTEAEQILGEAVAATPLPPQPPLTPEDNTLRIALEDGAEHIVAVPLPDGPPLTRQAVVAELNRHTHGGT